MKNKKLIYILIFILAVVAGYLMHQQNKKEVTENPEPIDTSSWEMKDLGNGESLKYPADLGTKYITPTDWPPAFNIYDEKFVCVEAGSETERAGQTQIENINENTYCVTKTSEGAAGSIYNQYAYAKEMGDETGILTFSLRFVQCGNYDEPFMSECRNEQESFDISPVIDEMFKTLMNQS